MLSMMMLVHRRVPRLSWDQGDLGSKPSVGTGFSPMNLLAFFRWMGENLLQVLPPTESKLVSTTERTFSVVA